MLTFLDMLNPVWFADIDNPYPGKGDAKARSAF
jgi:hypothetical protein